MQLYHYARLASVGFAGILCTFGISVSAKLGYLPSYAASIFGMGDVLQFGFSLVGFSLCCAAYVYASKTLKIWPCNPDSPVYQNLNYTNTKLSQDLECAFKNISEEIKFCVQAEQRAEIYQDANYAMQVMWQRFQKIQSNQSEPAETDQPSVAAPEDTTSPEPGASLISRLIPSFSGYKSKGQ